MEKKRFQISSYILGTPQTMTPTQCNCGRHALANVLLLSRLRGNLVLFWSNPSMSILRRLDPSVSLSTASLFCMRRYCWMLVKCWRWLLSSLDRSDSVVARLHRALNSAQMEHLTGLSARDRVTCSNCYLFFMDLGGKDYGF